VAVEVSRSIGGILVKLKQLQKNKNPVNVRVQMLFRNVDGVQGMEESSVSIPPSPSAENLTVFSSSGIRKGILLQEYVEATKKYLAAENDPSQVDLVTAAKDEMKIISEHFQTAATSLKDKDLLKEAEVLSTFTRERSPQGGCNVM